MACVINLGANNTIHKQYKLATGYSVLSGMPCFFVNCRLHFSKPSGEEGSGQLAVKEVNFIKLFQYIVLTTESVYI